MHLTSLVVVLALSGVQPERRSETVDLTGYLAELNRVQTTLSAASTLEQARAIAAATPDRRWVAAHGQVIVVDTGWIDEALGRDPWPAVREDIDRRLATMAASATESSANAHRPSEEVLQAVLARPEFHRERSSQWLRETRQRLVDWLLQFLDRFTPSGVTGRMAAVAFAWIVSIAALCTLALWVVTRLLRRSDRSWLELGASAPLRPAARLWSQQALDALHKGDLREAVRCSYHAAISRLEEQGVWAMDDSRTPREYLSLLPADDARSPVVTDVVRQFERIWYGCANATGDDARRVSAHLERLGCLHASERPTEQS